MKIYTFEVSLIYTIKIFNCVNPPIALWAIRWLYVLIHLSAHELQCSSNDWLATPTRTFPLNDINSTPEACGFKSSMVSTTLYIAFAKLVTEHCFISSEYFENVGVFFIGYPSLSFTVYPLDGTPYASAFATAPPNAVR